MFTMVKMKAPHCRGKVGKGGDVREKLTFSFRNGKRDPSVLRFTNPDVHRFSERRPEPTARGHDGRAPRHHGHALGFELHREDVERLEFRTKIHSISFASKCDLRDLKRNAWTGDTLVHYFRYRFFS